MCKELWGVALCIMLFQISSFAYAENETLNEKDKIAISGKTSDTLSNTPEIDSLKSKVVALVKSPSIPPRSYILPGAMITYGGIALASRYLQDVNGFAKARLEKNKENGKFQVDHVTMVLPALSVYAINAIGVKGIHNFKDRTALIFISSAICNGFVFGTKHLTSIQRPDNSDTYSFPSGHTAQAFASAEFMRLEYRNQSAWYGLSAYAVAIGTGVLRMHHNKHWFNDVIAGAGVGMLSTRLSYWLYPRIKKTLQGNKEGRDRNIAFTPTYNSGAVGFSLACSL